MQSRVMYPGSIFELRPLFMQLENKKVFLVTGKKSFRSCGAEEKLKWLFDTCEVTHFNDFQTNPDSEDVIKGVQLFNQASCTFIVSVGGGSVIDMAKLINYYHNAGIDTIKDSNMNNENCKPVTHICLPTTAGSGSESTHFAVMYIGNAKYSIAHPKLKPNYAIVDPELQYSQTPYQKAVSGVDALAQAIESFWSVQSTEESRLYSEKALNLVWQNLPAAVHKGDKLAHLYLAVGANLAGRAINISKTTAPHALSYGFTKYAGLPHGHAVALSLPYFLEIHSQVSEENCNDPRGVNHIKRVIENIASIMNCQSDKLANTLIDFLKYINIETCSKNLNIKKQVINQSVQMINKERLGNNPVVVDINDFIESAYKII